MGDIKGFLTHKRELPKKRNVHERINDYNEIDLISGSTFTKTQSSRCMDCGVPFCHSGCPLGNIIPDFNDAVYHGKWQLAYEILSSTNNFPEFTGRICPAPCEAACVLGINNDPVTIEYIEKSIIEKAFKESWVKANHATKTGKKIAVIGSGPAGLAAADQLNKAGHNVTVFERNTKPGGLLRYGIPDFKLEKWVIDRRISIMEESGVQFKMNMNIGKNIPIEDIVDEYDAVLLAGGSTIPRDLNIPGRELKGIHFAMEFLEQKNKQIDGQIKANPQNITATAKNVVVIGGGDTGSDCVGTSNREKARSVTQIELLTKPPLTRSEKTPWPLWPMKVRTSTSHEEGCDRKWAIMTKEFIGNSQNELSAIKLVDIDWVTDSKTGKSSIVEIAGSERKIDCDLALLAIGFLHPQHEGMLNTLNVKFDPRGNVDAQNYHTNIPGVFAAGDMRRGQSLVVWAITEGREAAVEIDMYLRGGDSVLESKDRSFLSV